jgi:glucoamylase
VTRLDDDSGLSAISGPNMVVLRTPVETQGRDLSTVASFTVAEGETIPFVLSHGPSHVPPPLPFDPILALHQTETFWRDWSSRCTYCGPYREAVASSLRTLKALTYAATGGIVAAPTTSLPEQPGGVRNWDYRYCWLRDATLTLQSFMYAGYFEEAQSWSDWLHRSVAGSADQVQIVYGLAGERHLTEWEVPWLPGYQGATPVRIGNAAAEQVQLDVYGEVMDALHHARTGGLDLPRSGWSLQCEMIAHLETIWHEPDEGIWETRGGPQQFTFSKVMAWVAFDRVIRTAEHFGLEAPLERWRGVRNLIHETVCTLGYDPELNSFVQSFGSKELDATLLLVSCMGFLPAEDPRVRGTVAAIERELLVNGFVQRYRTDDGKDGLPPGEGAFLACSFWLADAYAEQGRAAEARAMFERLLALRNDVGLLAEEYDPSARRQLGNFPQAFSHTALIGTALMLG